MDRADQLHDTLAGAESPLRPVVGDHGQFAAEDHAGIDDGMRVPRERRMRRNRRPENLSASSMQLCGLQYFIYISGFAQL